MNIFPHFRFKSITHRLIFACVIAAIVIYSSSFWHMRQVTANGVMAWMLQVAQSRVELVAAEVKRVLQSVEENTNIVVQIHPQATDKLNPSSLHLFKMLMAQQSVVQAMAYYTSKSTEILVKSSGLRSEGKGNYQVLSDREITDLITPCQNNSTTNQPFWVQPHQSNLPNEPLQTIYCVPVSSTLGQKSWFAVQINLDWLKPLVLSKMEVIDKFNNIEIGKPFVINIQTKQWVLNPQESTNKNQTPLWFSPDHFIWHNHSKQNLIETFNDNKGTIIFITLPSTSWTFAMAFTNGEFEEFMRKYLWLIIASMGKDMTLMCIVIAIASLQTTRPLQALITTTENIAQGDLDTVLPVISQHDEVGRLGRAFRHMRDALKIYIQELQETTVAKQKMESELSIASEIQRSMLPKVEVTDDGNRRYELSALLQPARQVGGDLYDFFLIGEDTLCIVIGDVADKGVPAALLMARTVTLIRIMAKQATTSSAIMSAINDELCGNNDECLFVTLFIGVLNLSTGRLDYASGGHSPPVLVTPQGVSFLELETGPALGLVEEAIFPPCEYILKPKELLILYTDGITEAMNHQSEQFSEEKLLEVMASYPPSNPARIIRTLQHFYRQFVGDAPQSDDLTLLALQYRPVSPFPKDDEIVEWKITINSELTELEKVKQRLGQILKTKGFTVELIEDAQLVVEEILVNIIQYGYTQEESQIIDLQIKISQDTLMMTFEDWGKPFNPLVNIEAPDLSMDDDERSLGGLGFYLVQELTDHIEYVYRDGKNILNILKRIR